MVFHAMLDHPVTSKFTKIIRLSIGQVGSGWVRLGQVGSGWISFGQIRSNHNGY